MSTSNIRSAISHDDDHHHAGIADNSANEPVTVSDTVRRHLITTQKRQPTDDRPIVTSPQTATLDLLARIEEKHDIGDVVASGGMGIIMQARDRNIRRNVAMKVMLKTRNDEHLQRLRFIMEAQVTGQLEHPSIVPVYELGVDANQNPYYTMKLIQGTTLRHILEELAEANSETVDSYPLHRLLTIFDRVCDAIAYAHSRSVIHRDLKPENIMIGDYGEVLILDWGLAAILATDGDETDIEATVPQSPHIESVREGDNADLLKTVTGTVVGTPEFMAPEQAQGKTDELDTRTDIYALGGILYKILTLRSPVTGSSVTKILDKVAQGTIVHPSVYSNESARRYTAQELREQQPTFLHHCPGLVIPDSLSAVAMKALANDPTKRYGSVKSLQSDITAYQRGFATSAESANLGKQLWLLVRRHKGAFSVAAVAVLVLVNVVVLAFARISREKAVALHERRVAEQAQANADQQKETALAAKERAEDVGRRAAPQFVERARKEMDLKSWRTALKSVETAVDLYPQLGAAWELKGLLEVSVRRYVSAKASFVQAQRHANDDNARQRATDYITVANEGLEVMDSNSDGRNREFTQSLARMLEQRGEFLLATRVLETSGNTFSDLADRKVQAAIAGLLTANRGLHAKTLWFDEDVDSNGLWFRCHAPELVDVRALAGLPVINIDVHGSGLRDLTGLAGLPLLDLSLASTPTEDISSLHGLRLKKLNLSGTNVSTIDTLSGMPLVELRLSMTRVRDLTPLRDMPLNRLHIDDTPISDISPLAGLPLVHLRLDGTDVIDISALAGMKLKTLSLAATHVTDMSVVAGMELGDVALPLQVKAGLNELRNTGVFTPRAGKPWVAESAMLQLLPLAPGTFKRNDVFVRITKPYWLGQYEVTQKQWQSVMGSNPSYMKGEHLPVETISWHDANAFCERLTIREHAAGRLPSDLVFRLPTEAEWEYACRAGTTTAYNFGNDPGQLFLYGNYNDRSSGLKNADSAHDDTFSATCPVGHFDSNKWGFYDMHGNVWEWTYDVFAPYNPIQSINPTGPVSGNLRVLRGGSWSSTALRCKSAHRNKRRPDGRASHLGFRVACGEALPRY